MTNDLARQWADFLAEQQQIEAEIEALRKRIHNHAAAFADEHAPVKFGDYVQVTKDGAVVDAQVTAVRLENSAVAHLTGAPVWVFSLRALPRVDEQEAGIDAVDGRDEA